MNGDELIAALQALTPEERARPVVFERGEPYPESSHVDDVTGFLVSVGVGTHMRTKTVRAGKAILLDFEDERDYSAF